MKKVIVIGCPGGGKSTFSRKLRDKTGLPLYHLDRIWHKPDKSHITQEAFDRALKDILSTEHWIIDGNYGRTIELRLQACDTVFFLDLPTEVCLEGARARVGLKREDMPWVEEELDEEFAAFIRDFADCEKPRIYELFAAYPDKAVVILRSHKETERYLKQL